MLGELEIKRSEIPSAEIFWSSSGNLTRFLGVCLHVAIFIILSQNGAVGMMEKVMRPQKLYQLAYMGGGISCSKFEDVLTFGWCVTLY